MLERRLASTEADLQQKLNSCQEVLPFFPSIHHENEKEKFCSPYRGSPIGFFNPAVLTQDFEQSRNPEDYFWHPTSRAYFQSRIPPDFAVKSRIPSFK